MKLLHVVGARPNYMKVAAVMQAVREVGLMSQVLVHTGQHYDAAMNDVFFADLGLPIPDHFLGVGSGTQAVQTARVMSSIEPVLEKERPDRVVVVGDVNSTIAATLVAVKMGIPVDHVEAGLRSFDRTMPEEINRIVTDSIADKLFIHSPEARTHLRREGRADDAIHYVGNVMIDSLDRNIARARERRALAGEGLEAKGYALVTLHRPANIDDPQSLRLLMDILGDLAAELPVLFPVHPRTQARLEAEQKQGLRIPERVRLTAPKGYLDFLQLMDAAKVVLTDSGGIQEETTALGVPCLTLRHNTERPITCEVGSNLVVGHDRQKIRNAIASVVAGTFPTGHRPEMWDGRAGARIAAIWSGSALDRAA